MTDAARHSGGAANGSPSGPPTIYVEGVSAPTFPELSESSRADVCVVGGGFTGLSTALHLARTGRSVVLLEAQRIGYGATGRNGGQLHSGQRRDQVWLEDKVGRDDAARLWELAEAAKDLVRSLIRDHDIDCGWTEGLIEAAHTRAIFDEERDYVAHLADRYGVGALSVLDRDQIAEATGSDRFVGGFRDASAGHLNPYALACGIARAAEAVGARLHEGSRVVRIEATGQGKRRVSTATAHVDAETVVLAGNGYLAGIEPSVEARVLPINNYVVATEPLGPERMQRLIPGGECVADTRFVVRYWRPTPDNRLVFGGGETYTRRLNADPAAVVRPYLAEIYPDLADVPIASAWGGTLAVTRHRMPFIRRVEPGLYAGCGYSGQGVGTATFAGKVLADGIAGDTGALDVFARLPVPSFPGGTLLRTPLLVLAMSWYALRDRL
ncbi:NAD(P)/FAD-dependent oxidoreductase [Amorphus orientalis]|uniref:Gamma-glutamylputrescine oxidase n=1 Tax=Amorphus orientalis TaxID=649198 RepID=A0AAE3VP66_9HYPH|nr:FAD-binding oxidoreductase [Amorphus orientalis]MDQ0315246.1 gamma-glutamylputrescine oxidase [Amorphus orientalis]